MLYHYFIALSFVHLEGTVGYIGAKVPGIFY
jgi:hypothetical protein